MTTSDQLANTVREAFADGEWLASNAALDALQAQAEEGRQWITDFQSYGEVVAERDRLAARVEELEAALLA